MQNLKAILARLKPLDPPPHLVAAVMARVHQLASAQARRIFWRAVALATLAVGGLVPATLAVVHQASTSGFFEYLSLFGSDYGAALANWRDYAYSLVESLPIVALALTLLAIFVLMVAVRRAATARPAIVSH